MGHARKQAQLEPPTQPWHHLAGTCLLSALALLAGAAPQLLPHATLVFLGVALPWRVVRFTRKAWAFFLVDYCYAASLAVFAFFLALPWLHQQSGSTGSSTGTLVQGVAAALYVLSEGPLAGALIAWQCAWVLESHDHAVSVLVHLLPGLAMFAYTHHWPQPASSHTLRSVLQLTLAPGASQHSSPDAPSGMSSRQAMHVQGAAAVQWLVIAPLAFYMAWQLLYFLVVQVLFRPLIRARRYDTSYNCLARRAARSESGLNTLVRSGSVARRITMYGALQLGFTIVTGAWAAATYYCYPLAVAWQVVKWVAPLYYGACQQARKEQQQQQSESQGLGMAAAKPVVSITAVCGRCAGLPDVAITGNGKKRQ
mmetsp:Transcript_3008/g.7455  ORF Transcript_3008/g.7455 Transcript_3008/m.7455 type:complete len:368 (-) Transcript_3008:383-1486(-)|eukprot:CAMPEP_0202882418 /NCGR_PEP_ID=MMETSP1391-20130828/37962_1 /ASSEMBLY_ACC=CAM_ASM_000867 /TAXON_ID=1034604 /ORGANISM="Chlamydomonas leiostraca, Strain SAG 11-49" /LENGTH=367 /DNA_ID=CAMNT_0049565273 /DNA_START=137 /DNA_END=1240 /DNA_ORIENTATION=+